MPDVAGSPPWPPIASGAWHCSPEQPTDGVETLGHGPASATRMSEVLLARSVHEARQSALGPRRPSPCPRRRSVRAGGHRGARNRRCDRRRRCRAGGSPSRSRAATLRPPLVVDAEVVPQTGNGDGSARKKRPVRAGRPTVGREAWRRVPARVDSDLDDRHPVHQAGSGDRSGHVQQCAGGDRALLLARREERDQEHHSTLELTEGRWSTRLVHERKISDRRREPDDSRRSRWPLPEPWVPQRRHRR